MARKKFIPDSDAEFDHMAQSFARHLAEDPKRYDVPEEDCRAIVQAVQEYRAARIANSQPRTKSVATAAAKNEKRAAAESLIRRAAHRIRNNPAIGVTDKFVVGIKPRAERLRRQGRPETAPWLFFDARARGNWGSGDMHIIHFRDHSDTLSDGKPEDAVRMELYVDLVPPNEPIPSHPGKRRGGVMWYLRSFTRSPLKVEYPKSDVPMRVVYWGRWANATGEQGPFSQPLEAPIEATDWSRFALPAPAEDADAAERIGRSVTVTIARRELPQRVETIDAPPAEPSRLLEEKQAEKDAA